MEINLAERKFMNQIKAIETEYKGYKFRSRLEAKWAVFFDLCGIPYEYELEGYKLKSGYYLPDFYLPWFKCFVEIKPSEDEEVSAKIKLNDLFFEHSDCCCMLCIGDPLNNNIELLCMTYDESSGGTGWFNCRFLVGVWYRENEFSCTKGKHYITLALNTWKYRDLCTNSNSPLLSVVNECEIESFDYDFENEKISARQARFEHGECGY